MDIVRNFREVLWFWLEYYTHRGRDRLSLEFSSHIRFSEWMNVVSLLVDECDRDVDSDDNHTTTTIASSSSPLLHQPGSTISLSPTGRLPRSPYRRAVRLTVRSHALLRGE
jgi:hypothetical protein